MDLINVLLSNVWAVILIILFFGGSIFVHELGHFLAARWRGMHVDRFSIGFGPRMFGWKGKDGVEYRVSWLPLGGYVALPQLADLKGLEGEPGVAAEQLPPASYTDKMCVAVAGAVFNILFAFLLALVLWKIGQPQRSDEATTRIGYVLAKLRTSDQPSPALAAGLQAGDRIVAIDGQTMKDWRDVRQTIVTGAGRTADGRRQSVFTVERDGRLMDLTLYPRLGGDENMREVGIAPAFEMVVHGVDQGTLAAKAGVLAGDRIVSINRTAVLSSLTYYDLVSDPAEAPLTLRVRRGASEQDLIIPPRPANLKDRAELGMTFMVDNTLIYENPVEQFSSQLRSTWQTLKSLVNPHSDVGISKLSGPLGIMRVFHMAAQADIRLVLWFTILVNINLAVFNLLPIPVLDGGHMLFATIGKLRGRSLPANFIAATQSVFVVLLFSMIIYVTFFDARRFVRDLRASDEPAPAAADRPAPSPAPSEKPAAK